MLQPNDKNQVSTNGNAEDKLNPGGILLDSGNCVNALIQPFANNKGLMLMNGKDYWHKVTVLNAAARDKEYVLKVIMDFVHPRDMIPAMCRDDGVHMYFLIRRCGKAIEKLCRSRLTIETADTRLVLQLVLGFANVKDIPLNMQECLTKAIRKRYNYPRRHLDLSDFHRDPELIDTFYCPLSQGRILHCVMGIAVNSQLTIKSVNLSKNNLSFVRNLGSPWQFKHVTKVDVRQNAIENLAELVYLRQNNLRELLLDLNPLCEKYDNENSYIEDIRNALPSLVKLDGVILPPPGFPRFKKNFIISEDDITLADQFIRQYFTVYDTENRRKLEGLYHKEALFSLSATYLPAQSTSNTARLTEYTIESRNLLKSSDYSKNMRLIRRGPEAIMATTCKLPRTEHDPYSFTVDVIPCVSGLVISVKGLFKEPAIFKTPLVRSFYRVFVLVKVAPKSYQIGNESMHICNATTKEAEAAFKTTKPVIPPSVLASTVATLKETEKDKIADTMSKLTTMNKKWSKKCLEETKWDIKEALVVFTELYKMNKIPQEAFLRT